jgi:glyoxylase-like metal-dependent hydrolase (beta-lactamase superfamily II)/8-oxo-dGTP pyrophosphatase MutT (NUDIX family)
VDAIARAASVLLVRGPDPFEIFAVQRAAALRFFGGFHAFPGGKVVAGDAQTPIGQARFARPESLKDVRTAASGTDPEAVGVVTAARELFEETGVLVARRSDGSWPTPQADSHRRALAGGTSSFADILGNLGLAIWECDFQPLGRLVTPPISAHRFDTSFFLVEMPPQQHAEVWPGELQAGSWLTPSNLMRQWEHGECLIAPPTVLMLRALESVPLSKAAEVLAALFREVNAGAVHPIYFAPDVQMIPLRTQGLPPSTHTNAYLVGRDRAYLLDPGPAQADEQERLFAVVDAFRARGGCLRAIVLTHHHSDHIGATTACAQRYQVPVWAHPLTALKLQDKIPISRLLQDGEKLELGRAPDGFAPWQLEAIHTPGHAPGHLAFYEPHYRLLFVGDMVSTISSIVIAPPDGELATYLKSLRRLRVLPARLLLPAHGNPSSRPTQTLDECLEHRRKREEMLIGALGIRPRAVADLAMELYKGVPDELIRFARLQVLAGLQKLEAEGRAKAIGDQAQPVWVAAGSEAKTE